MLDAKMTDPSLCQLVETALQESVSWELIDAVLLDLCARYPLHRDKRHVIAKVALIGRTYVTGIERAFDGGTKQGDALSRVVDHIHRNGERLDQIVSTIPSQTNLLSDEALDPIVSAHYQFLQLLQECEHCHRNPRSFVSKYLHFHRPNVPIYDSYAAGVISSVLGSRTRQSRRYGAADSTYASYVEKFWRLAKRVSGAGRRCSVKELDTYLLWEAYRRGLDVPAAQAQDV
jgi:hypothetical protein